MTARVKTEFCHEMDKNSVDPAHVQRSSPSSCSSLSNNGRLTEPLSQSTNTSSILSSPTKSFEILSLPSPESKPSAKIHRTQDLPTPQFIDHLPRVDDVACTEFEVLKENVFVQKKIGCSHQSLDMMICECQYDPCSDDLDVACGASSHCINRLTQVECLPQECPSQNFCRNQRFARRMYPEIEIVRTANKGYGLRAGSHLTADAFVYEYIGEVISETMFRKRIRQYADEGIQHFYFMMLQKGEYIDATRKGGIARFLNHSCNPNCYVAKWVVGEHMRMGIFAKRDIRKGEELTFNYNVDRYGYDAQKCYCGETQCLGTIGGKTQTDIGTMDQLYIDALGIAEDIESWQSRGTKRRESPKPILRPMEPSEARVVVTAIRQAVNDSNAVIISQLLRRINITQELEVHTEFIRLKGYVMIRQILEMSDIDEAIVQLALEAADKWQPRHGNSVQESGLPGMIEEILSNRSEAIQTLAKNLIRRWQLLPMHYVIPALTASAKFERPREDDEIDTKPRWREETRPIEFSPAPVVRPAFPVKLDIRDTPPPSQGKGKISSDDTADQKAKLESILAAAKCELPSNEESVSSETRESSGRGRQSLKGERHKDRHKKKRRLTSEELKDQHLKMLIKELVIQNMSKYKQEIDDRDTFKKHAKECSDLLFQKEQRNASYSSSAYETLTEEKRKQMKNFIKMFSAKVVKGLVERRKSVRGPGHRMSKLQDSHSDPSSSFCTPTEGNFAISPSGALNQGQAEGIKLSGSENGNTHLQDTVIIAARAL